MKIINKLTQFIDKAYSRVTGRHHQYRVVLGFKPKGCQAPSMFTVCRTFGLTYRDGESFYRAIRKHYGESFIKCLPKDHLKNGHITIEHIAYLGRF